jgi:hypothetical protein
LARKALYKHATQVNTTTHPDDGSSPVGSNEWNADPDQAGMLGVTPTTSTITIASGVATVTDSVTVVAAESGTSDVLDKLAITNTNQYDLIYLFADTGDTITLTNTSSPSADGHIKTISGSNETLSSTVPTIVIRRGNYWYGYGGGVVNAVSDIGDVTITGNSSGELLKWSGSAWVNNTLTEAGIVDGNLGTPSALVGTNISGTAANLTAGNATLASTVTTNANLTGEVTSSGNATTIADNFVDEANLKVSNSPTNGLFLQAQSGNTGGLTWASAGGGATLFHNFANSTTTSYAGQSGESQTLGTAVGTLASGSGTRDVYIRKIDTNNEGVFTVIHKNGTLVEVQIA